MSNLKREWNPCKICKKYYTYECSSSIKNCKKFIPDNSFRNFLAINNYSLVKNYDLDKIYFIDKDTKINLNEESLDLRNASLDTIKDILHFGRDFCHTFILDINDDIRDFIYNDDYIMDHYDITMLLSSNIKQSLKHRLDERFKFFEFKGENL